MSVHNRFDFIPKNSRPDKPRKTGITEIRAAYYTPFGTGYLEDILEAMGPYVDSIKYAGGSFTLMPDRAVQRIIDICHKHDVLVSTGGFVEYALMHGSQIADRYIQACADAGFDILEISSGFITIPVDDMLRVVEKVQKAGLKPKPEIGIQFGAGGASTAEELEAEGSQDVGWVVSQVRRYLEAGVYMIMIESEGITESVRAWRTDVPASIISQVGLEKIMFEAADPEVFGWYIKNYGPDVNLFVDHSQLVQLECLRQGIWGTKSLWGRVVTYGREE
jgi:phosphosulfolactate synthase (CoM biosynthesis protein A)